MTPPAGPLSRLKLAHRPLACALAAPVLMVLGVVIPEALATVMQGPFLFLITMLAELGSVALMVAAVVLGLRALAQHRRAPDEGGRGFAVAGVVLGALELILPTFVIIKVLGGGLAHGRPLRIDGRAHTAPTRAGAGWALGLPPDVTALDASTRAALAAAWTADAALEHASVAAFAQLSLALMGLGAPPSLVARAHRAAAQEIEHTTRCYAFAGAYAGHPLTAAPLPALLEGLGRQDRAGVAAESLWDGCFGEAFSAEVARAEAAEARDPVVGDFLATVAREEEEHAELAWDVLDFCLSEGDATTRHAVSAMARRLAVASLDGAGATDEGPSLVSHGRLDGPRRAEIHARMRRAVCARVAPLLQRTSGQSGASLGHAGGASATITHPAQSARQSGA